MNRIVRLVVFIVWSLTGAAPAAAHIDTTGAGPVYDGAWHLLSAPELLTPLVAIALAAGLTARQAGRQVMTVISIGWLLGSGAGCVLPAVGPGPALAAVSVTLVLGGGALLLAERPVWLLRASAAAMSMVGGFTSTTGYAFAADAILIIGGETGAAVAVGLISAAIGVKVQARGLALGARYLGSCVMAFGLIMAAWSVRTSADEVARTEVQAELSSQRSPSGSEISHLADQVPASENPVMIVHHVPKNRTQNPAALFIVAAPFISS